MPILALIPTQREFDHFLENVHAMGQALEPDQIGRLTVYQARSCGLTLGMGDLGKNRFGIHTQHLLENGPGWDLMVCAGAAGGLSHTVSIGDIVLGRETVEHDIYNGFGPPIVPEYMGDSAAIEHAAGLSSLISPNQIHIGRIASGDEDVMGHERQAAIVSRTGGVVVAWEGAGAAHVCQFFEQPFLEIRGMSDYADSEAADAYLQNLPMVMLNITKLLFGLAECYQESKPESGHA